MMHVCELLKEHKLTNIEGVDENGNSLLHLTVNSVKLRQKEIIEVFEILLGKGIDPNIKNKNNETVLRLAVKSRMRDVINLLLAHNTNIDDIAHYVIEDEYEKFYKLSTQKDNNNCHELDGEMKNVEAESANHIEWLISRGFYFDRQNQAALLMAIERNLQHILPTLLKSSKDITFLDQDNRTLLHLFLEKNVATNQHGISRNWYSKRYTADIVKILLDRGISADAEDKSKNTPVRLAIKKEEDIDIVELLIERSTNVNQKDSDGETLFQCAIKLWTISKEKETNYFAKIAGILIAKGADIDEPKNNEYRPLFYAIQGCNLRIVEFLREHGADFGVITKSGETLMHRFLGCNWNIDTVDGSEMSIFDLLLERTTNIHQKNCRGQTVLHVAIRKWIYTTSAKADYFIKIARAFIAKGADVNEADNTGMTPLVHAIERHNLRVVQFLEENGANFNVSTVDAGNLMHLLVNGCNEAVQEDLKLFDILLSHGCQVNCKNRSGMTPLHIAVNRGNPAIVQRLLAHNADVNSKNDQMKTPLTNMLTSYYKLKADLAELLLEHGADIDAKDIEGFTALQAATINRSYLNVNLLQYLLEHGADFNARTQVGHSVLGMAIGYDYNNIEWGREPVGPDERLPSLATCVDNASSKEVEILLKYWIKLNVANLKCDIDDEYRDIIKKDKYKRYYEVCLKEVELLKNIFIGSRTSFYTFLHMDPNSRRAYIYGEQRQIIHSPILKEEFPEYASLILASYYEAVVRHAILKPATEAWLKLTKIDLLDICIEHILSFLSNSDLFLIIGKD